MRPLLVATAAVLVTVGGTSAVSLSNVALPKDSAGRQLITGEADV